MTGIASMAPVNANGTMAAYGGYAATPGGEAAMMASKFNPFRYLLTGQQPPAAPQVDPAAAPANGYAAGGIADASSIVSLLAALGNRRQQSTPASSNGPGNNYADGAANTDSGANYGPTNLGFDGLSQGRLGATTGIGLALNAAGKAVPGAGAIGAIGQAFNGGVAGLQSQEAQDQATGIASSFGQTVGAAINGALGIGTTGLGGYGPANKGGMTGMENSMDPGAAGMRSIAKDMADNYATNGNVTDGAPALYGPGTGIAGVAGAAATGQAAGTGLNTADSAAAFGQGFAGPTAGSVGNDGVASVGGQTSAGFGSSNAEGSVGTNAGNSGPASNGEGGQSGTGASSNSGGSDAGGGGQQGGNGSEGDGGGGSGAGSNSYAAGGVIRDTSGGYFDRKLAHGSGLVTGLSSGRGDKIPATVPKGSYVVPADVVSGMGGGNTQAGGHMLKKMMPGTGQGMRFAQGGIAGGAPQPVSIQISPGEFVVHPDHVAALGNGDPQAGANLLDGLVSKVRQSNMQVATGMPAPR